METRNYSPGDTVLFRLEGILGFGRVDGDTVIQDQGRRARRYMIDEIEIICRTPQQIFERASQFIIDNGHKCSRTQLLAAFTATMIDEAMQMRWIHVSEQMPKNNQRILIATPEPVSVRMMYKDGVSSFLFEYWMPLPDAPKSK